MLHKAVEIYKWLVDIFSEWYNINTVINTDLANDYLPVMAYCQLNPNQWTLMECEYKCKYFP